MVEAPIPEDEAKRLELLRACNIIYTPAEAAFDDVARLAADLCGAEIALITLVDADYQWFKARVGVEQIGTPRDLSFCGHCISHKNALIIEDTLADDRFKDNPLVTGDPNLRFYAGVPLIIGEGSSIGALSVADRRPRSLSPKELSALESLARQIAREIDLRRDLGRAERASPSSRFTLPAGETIGGRWRVVREIARGGAGVVFEAIDADGERAAVKVLLPEWASNEQIIERFVREARVLMLLSSPHVGQLLDVGNLDVAQGALPYLALEYLEGTDLDHVLEARGRVPFQEAFAWCADACDGVAAAHELGVIHRDLKPSNVFLAQDAESSEPVVKVLDFGIASKDPFIGKSPKITTMGSVIGTPVYMAPEQMVSSSDVDPRTDVWSMGAVLYELVTGSLPFRGDNDLQVFANIMMRPPLPLSVHMEDDPPRAVEEVLLRCLSRDRGERYGSMRELATALRAAL